MGDYTEVAGKMCAGREYREQSVRRRGSRQAARYLELMDAGQSNLPRSPIYCLVILGIFIVTLSSGCHDHMRTPTEAQFAAFENAGIIQSTVDMDQIEKAKLKIGSYRVVPGDILELTMPALLNAVTASEVEAVHARAQTNEPYLCRVTLDGTIALPAVGEIHVADQTLAQIEQRVNEAYNDYLVAWSSVLVRVNEYHTAKVYIAGAVTEPGVYSLRADQMTLSCLLTEAKGISEAGAAVVRIVRSGDSSTDGDEEITSDNAESQPIILPVVNANIPFQDVALLEGDTVIVEQIQVPLFSVLGLVNKPGNFEYPPGTTYNVTQAIAFAGGLDAVAEPRYVTIYRLQEDGSVVRLPLRLVEHDEFTDALGTVIRPGDVVAIEHTLRTHATTLIKNLIRINMGVYLSGRDLWGD